MKKMLLILLSAAILVSMVPVCVASAATEGFCDGYHYAVDDGYATITYYGGDDTDIVIPVTLDGYPVISVGYGAFANNDTIISVTIGDRITTIGDRAFEECDLLVSVIVGNGVTTIGGYAFYGCDRLAEVVLGSGVTSIEGYAFGYCYALTSLTLGKNIESVGASAFYDPSYYSYYTIDDHIWYAGSMANKNAITIKGNENYYLKKATWHYYTCTENHSYDNDCDSSCGKCSYTRTNSHTYDNACDADCNKCGEIRTEEDGKPLSHIYAAADCTQPKTCTRCQATEGQALGHIYTSECDAFCDRCYTRRYDFHDYAKATCTEPKICKVCGETDGEALGHTYNSPTCDKDCDVCGEVRATVHKYKDDCDIDCDLCGEQRTVTHKFDNDCDAYCNVCNEYREVADHVYSHRCDRDCNVCFAIRSVSHKYSGKCDSTCNYCGSIRTASAHTYQTTAVTRATLTKDGYSLKKCADCGETYGSKTVIKKVGNIKLSTTSYTYDGKVKTPTVTVKDSAGKTLKKNTDYTVSYASGRKNVGTYKVTITFKGKYSGTKVLTFKINPKAASVNKLTAKTKGLTVKLNRQLTQSTGYQIQYATSKSFKSYKTTTATYKTSTKSISGLKAKTTYYVRVRTYKTVSGVKYYSNWSTVKYMKTK